MATYRFRLKRNGSIGGLVYTAGMNVEVTVSPDFYEDIPFISTREKLFVQEFIDKYGIEARHHASVRFLFNQDYLEAGKI